MEEFMYFFSLAIGILMGFVLFFMVDIISGTGETDYIEALTSFTECYKDSGTDQVFCEDNFRRCEIVGSVHTNYYVQECREKKPLTCLGC